MAMNFITEYCSNLQNSRNEYQQKALAVSKLEKEIRAIQFPDFSEVVDELADRIANRINAVADIQGPVGMYGKYVVTFTEIKRRGKKTYKRLVIEPPDEDTAAILYETGRQDSSVRVGPLAALSRREYEVAPLPNSLDEILKILEVVPVSSAS